MNVFAVVVFLFGSIGFCMGNKCYAPLNTIYNEPLSRRCQLCNDPHFVTWDGTRVDSHIECPLILAQPCTEEIKEELAAEGIPDFKIVSTSDRNEACKDDGNNNWCPANARSVTFKIGIGNGGFVDYQITHLKEFKFQNAPFPYPATLPAITPVGTWWIDVRLNPTNANYLDMTASFQPGEFKLEFTLKISRGCIFVHMNGNMGEITQRKLCGACGQHNFDTCQNDFTWSDGTVFNATYDPSTRWFDYVAQSFYENDPAGSYIIDDPTGCDRDPRMIWGDTRTDPDPPMAEGRKKRASGVCNTMTEPNGAFASCQGTPEFQFGLDTCNFDVQVGEEYGCTALESAAETCRAATGLPIGDWRTPAGCELACSNGKVYSTTINRGCIKTCYNYWKGDQGCSYEGIEDGCVCPDNQVWNGDSCIPALPYCEDQRNKGLEQMINGEQCANVDDFECLIVHHTKNAFCDLMVGSALMACLRDVYTGETAQNPISTTTISNNLDSDSSSSINSDSSSEESDSSSDESDSRKTGSSFRSRGNGSRRSESGSRED